MGKNRSKNKRKREKQAQNEKKQEEKTKLDMENRKKNTEIVSTPEHRFVKENWNDEGEDQCEEIINKKSRRRKLATQKNQDEQVERMEMDDKPPSKNKDKNQQMKTIQYPDQDTECQVSSVPISENEISKDSKLQQKKTQEKKLKHDTQQKGDKGFEHSISNAVSSSESENQSVKKNSDDRGKGQWKDVKHVTSKNQDNQFDSKEVDNKPQTTNRKKQKQMDSQQYSDNNTKSSGKEHRGKNPPHEKDTTRERYRNHSSQRRNDSRNRSDGHSSHRREDDSRHGHGNQNKNHFNDRGSRNDSNNRSNCHAHNSGYPRRDNNHRNDHIYDQHKDKKFEPPYGRQDQENRNSVEKGNRLRGERNTHQKSPPRRTRWELAYQSDKKRENTSVKSNKKNERPLFVPNAHLYEPTIREIKGDLFESSVEYSLAHCVAEDLSMGAGIAVEFKKRFQGVQKLIGQGKKVGEVAILPINNRFIFYLITKRQSFRKPTINSIATAIKSLKQSCLELNVKKLAIPRIGCGLDRLNWDEVKNILYEEFSTTDIEIVVYVW